jgi:hypothetical protein
MKYLSQVYKENMRYGVRVFDLIPSVLLPAERISDMTLSNLEAAAELQGWDWQPLAQPYRLPHKAATAAVSAAVAS